MATAGSSVRVQRNACGLASVLLSAVLEWLLMLLLFLNAFFSYMVTKFASFCELQTPCLFCSRLDHFLGSERPGFYRNLICRAHKLEISTLAYCQVHEKLSGAGGMCGGCISSVPTSEKSDYGACKSSTGKSDPYIEYCVDNDHNIHLKSHAIVDDDGLHINFHGDDLLKDPLFKGPSLSSAGMALCSCCKEPLTKPFPQKLLWTKSIESIAIDVPSSAKVRHGYLDHQDGLRKRREKLFGSTTGSYMGNRGSDPLAYVGYTELKITSDSESEVPILDDDTHGPICETEDMKEGLGTTCVQLETDTITGHISPKTVPSDLAPDKLNHDAAMAEPSLTVPLEKFHIRRPHDAVSLESSATISNGLLELHCNEDEARDNSPAVSKLISSDELSSSDNVKEALVEVTKEKYVMGIGDMVCVSDTENKEVSKQDQLVSNNSTAETNQAGKDAGQSISSCMDLNDAFKLAVGSKGSQPHATFTELLSAKDSTSINDDLKLLLSQISAVRGFELSWSDMSPRGEGHSDDSKTSDISTAIGLQILPKRLSIDRHESGFESLDGSLSEIEGESIIDRLKRQIELDRKSLSALYKELEEERSASAIAANQAMAMINRLQEDKAAMHMEALQYQRMMEEQAEYDQEALQKLNDILAEREKEMQDLEEELETYKRRYSNALEVNKISELESDSKEGEMRFACHEYNTNYKANKIDTQKYSLLDFEDEKLYILKCLKGLQNKLHLFSNMEVHVNACEIDSNRNGFGNNKCMDMTPRGVSEDEHQPLFADHVTVNGGSPHMELLVECGDEEVYSTSSTENNIVAIQKQISQLNERLRTLEEDQNFLEHTVNSLRNGNEGLHFVQEIASHLRELQRFQTGTKVQAVA